MYFRNIATRLLSLLFAAAVWCTACQKEKIAPAGALSITFENTVSGNTIEYGKIQYKNQAGNLFSVNSLKYYLSDIALIADDGRAYELHNCDLIDVFDPESQKLALDSVPNGRYTKMRFNVGVDSVRNSSGNQIGDLNPSYGMLWNWTSGYIFYKHEGRFVNVNGDTLNLIYHLGTDAARTAVEIPLNNIEIKGNTQALLLGVRFDLADMYGRFDMEEIGSAHASGEPKDQDWMAVLKEGFTHAFSQKPQ